MRPVVLGRALEFPDPRRFDEEGCVAVGGDLSVERLLLAYRSGIYPWSVDPITWWSPDPRGLLDLRSVHVSRSLERVLRRKPFEVTRDRAFREVIEACAEPGPGRERTWISPEFVAAYCELHARGHAHSVECWAEGRLAGGIYGVTVGGLFAGESMFYRASNASKVALLSLVDHLRARGFRLFDVQMVTPATAQLGAVEVPRADYLVLLQQALKCEASF